MARLTKATITILLIGSIWGFLEATLGGFLHLLNLPIAGKIMAPIGFTLLFWALKNNLKPAHLILIAVIAASFKFLDPFLFGMNFFNIKVINPAQAIVMQGLVFAVVAKFFRPFEKSSLSLALTATLVFSATYLAASLYSFYVNYYVMGAFDIGLGAVVLHIILGSALTATGFSAIQFMTRETVFQIRTLPTFAQATLSLVLIAGTVIAQIVLH